MLARVVLRMLSTPPSMREIAISFLALLLLSVVPGSAHAQVFIASHPQPEFSIGPLFVTTSVGQQNVENLLRSPSSLTISVSWSLTLPPHRRAADIAQDLYLLWPGEAVGTAGTASADPALVRQVEALGFKLKQHGGLRLSARARTEMGTCPSPKPSDLDSGAPRSVNSPTDRRSQTG